MSEEVTCDVQLRDEQAAENREPEAGRVVPHRLGDPGRLAVREPRGSVDGVGARRPEHEPHACAGEDDVPDLRAELEPGHLAGPEPEADRGQDASEHDRPLRADPVEHPAADLGGDDEAEEEVEEHQARRRRRLAEAICAYSLAKKKTGTKTSIAMPSTRFSTRNGRIRKISDLDQRRGGTQLDQREHDEERRADDDAAEIARVAPAPDRRLLEPEDAQPDAGRDQPRAPVVHARGPEVGAGFDERDQDERDRRATGMLTQKMARQVHCVRKPPRAGPTGVSPPAIPKKRASALPRS